MPLSCTARGISGHRAQNSSTGRLQIGVGRQEHKIIALFCTHGGLNIPAYLRQSALPVCIPGAHAPGAQKAQVFLREGALQKNAFGALAAAQRLDEIIHRASVALNSTAACPCARLALRKGEASRHSRRTATSAPRTLISVVKCPSYISHMRR